MASRARVAVACLELLLASMLFFITSAHAHVKVFATPDPENKSALKLRSASYKVSIKQGDKLFESFVYESKTNFEKPEQQSDFNHWTTFEFAGEVEVIVSCLQSEISSADIYPARWSVKPSILKNELRFTITKPCKLLVEIKGMEEHPLFLFADEPEKNVPKRGDKNVLWFEAGKIHQLGLQYKVPNGTIVYIEGGAVVWGTFVCENGKAATEFKGKGIITTRSDERKPGPSNIPFSTIYSGECDIKTEGITITDPVHFCIIGRGKVETENVKLFAWYHQTDGWGGGDNSTIDDSFIKVFDDNVKLYGNRQRATNLVIYQQHNGAPFQLSWGGQSGNNCLAENIDLVKCRVNKTGGSGNSAFLNLRKGSDKFIGNITVRNVRADQGLYQLIGIGNDKSGEVKNLLLEDIHVRGGQQQLSYIQTQPPASTSVIEIKNVTLGNRCFNMHDIQTGGAQVELKISCQ